MNLSLFRSEAWAMNTFYGNSEGAGENRGNVGGMKKFLAVAAIAPSILIGRSDVLTHAQKYAQKGKVFKEGDNSVVIDLEIESKLESERKKAGYLLVAGLLVTSEPFYEVVLGIVRNPSSIENPITALNIGLLTATGVLLGHFWWTYIGLEPAKSRTLRF
ncbi:hypothetical protein ACFLY9_01735 [Patescibacteria group bacterium]